MRNRVSSLHCLFSFDNKLGGSVHAALNVCKYLAKGGNPVEVVAPYAHGDDVGYLSSGYPEVLCHRVRRSFPKRFSNSRELGSWLDANIHRFDVVEVHGVWVLATLQAARACQRHNKPYLLRPHGSLDPFDLRKRALAKRLLGPLLIRPVLASAAGVLCTSELEAERLETYGSHPGKRVVPLPVPPATESGNRSAFRDRHGIPRDAKVVLFMSRIDYKKGLEYLIPALALMKREHPRLWFLLAGSGTPKYCLKIHELLETSGVAAWTIETGFISGVDKANALAAADLFVLPSLNENFGIVLLEAMRAGLPLLVSDEVYIHREISTAGAGLVCRPETEAVAATLHFLLSEVIDLPAMGARGRELVQRRFSPDVATGLLIDIYRETLRGRGKNN